MFYYCITLIRSLDGAGARVQLASRLQTFRTHARAWEQICSAERCCCYVHVRARPVLSHWLRGVTDTTVIQSAWSRGSLLGHMHASPWYDLLESWLSDWNLLLTHSLRDSHSVGRFLDFRRYFTRCSSCQQLATISSETGTKCQICSNPWRNIPSALLTLWTPVNLFSIV